MRDHGYSTLWDAAHLGKAGTHFSPSVTEFCPLARVRLPLVPRILFKSCSFESGEHCQREATCSVKPRIPPPPNPGSREVYGYGAGRENLCRPSWLRRVTRVWRHAAECTRRRMKPALVPTYNEVHVARCNRDRYQVFQSLGHLRGINRLKL